MKQILALVAVALALGATTMSFDAEAARRLGGGKSLGMQRTVPAQPAKAPPAANNAAPTQTAPAAGTAAATAAPAAAAAATKRGWMGPIAGIAAGLGIAALASHFGFGEALANMLTIGLLVMGALMLVGFIMRKRAQGAQGAQPAYAGAGSGGPAGMQRESARPHGGSLIGSRIGSQLGAVEAPPASTLPAGFDAAGFARNARDQFMALQAANDARDLERLRDYLTPDMFEAVRADIAARGDAPQKTEVFGLDAQVLEVAEEGAHYFVSVRFRGSVRDEPGAPTEDLDEMWVLTKPRTGAGGWLIAGIQQLQEG